MKKSKISKGGLISIFLGIFSIIAGLITYSIRPFQDCSWWNIICQGSGLATSWVFYLLMILFVGAGFILLGIGSIIFLIKILS